VRIASGGIVVYVELQIAHFIILRRLKMSKKDEMVWWVCPNCGETWYWYRDCAPLVPTCSKCRTTMVLSKEDKGEV